MLETKFALLLFLSLNLGIFMEIDSLCSNCFEKSDFNRKSKLEMVHLIYRHGDRSPINDSLGSPYNLTYWPDGWGQLTNLGIQQHYKLGTWLRSRYSDFLPRSYNLNDIYVQSSDVDRTLQSAASNLAGLYKPKKSENWNSKLLWRPIPIHTRPVNTDYLIAASVPTTCTSYQKALKKYQESPELQAELKKADKYFDYVSASTNATVETVDRNFLTLLLWRDMWVCDAAHNLTIPSWAQPLFQDKEFYQAALTYYYLSSNTTFLAKFSSGFLLKDILDRQRSKVAKTLVPDRKCWVYSTHDSVVFAFLNSLGVSDHQFASYTATIIVELRSYRNEPYVQLFYKQLDEAPQNIEIPGCGCYCRLENMYQIYDNIIPKRPFEDECKFDE